MFLLWSGGRVSRDPGCPALVGKLNEETTTSVQSLIGSMCMRWNIQDESIELMHVHKSDICFHCSTDILQKCFGTRKKSNKSFSALFLKKCLEKMLSVRLYDYDCFYITPKNIRTITTLCSISFFSGLLLLPGKCYYLITKYMLQAFKFSLIIQWGPSYHSRYDDERVYLTVPPRLDTALCVDQNFGH